MFQHIQLNLDKTGIIQAEEMLEWLQSVLLVSPSLSPSISQSLNLFFYSFLSTLSFVFLFISKTKLDFFGQSHFEDMIFFVLNSVVWT